MSKEIDRNDPRYQTILKDLRLKLEDEDFSEDHFDNIIRFCRSPIPDTFLTSHALAAAVTCIPDLTQKNKEYLFAIKGTLNHTHFETIKQHGRMYRSKGGVEPSHDMEEKRELMVETLKNTAVITFKTLLQIVDVCPSTLYRWISEGAFVFVRRSPIINADTPWNRWVRVCVCTQLRALFRHFAAQGNNSPQTIYLWFDESGADPQAMGGRYKYITSSGQRVFVDHHEPSSGVRANFMIFCTQFSVIHTYVHTPPQEPKDWVQKQKLAYDEAIPVWKIQKIEYANQQAEIKESKQNVELWPGRMLYKQHRAAMAADLKLLSTCGPESGRASSRRIEFCNKWKACLDALQCLDPLLPLSILRGSCHEIPLLTTADKMYKTMIKQVKEEKKRNESKSLFKVPSLPTMPEEIPEHEQTSRGLSLSTKAIYIGQDKAYRLDSTEFLQMYGSAADEGDYEAEMDEHEVPSDHEDELPEDTMDDFEFIIPFPYKPKLVLKFKRGITKAIVKQQVLEAIRKVREMYPGCRVVLMCDNAPIHVDLFNGGNGADITAFMAPYTPEMNPPEGVFNSVKWDMADKIKSFPAGGDWVAWVRNVVESYVGFSTVEIVRRVHELIDLYIEHDGSLNKATAAYHAKKHPKPSTDDEVLSTPTKVDTHRRSLRNQAKNPDGTPIKPSEEKQ